MPNPGSFNVLSLDGGGAMGVYTLGILMELEADLGAPLSARFQLIFDTSAGAIIAALLGLGESVAAIERLYFKLIPDVMGAWWPRSRSARFRARAKAIFGERKFDTFATHVVGCT